MVAGELWGQKGHLDGTTVEWAPFISSRGVGSHHTRFHTPPWLPCPQLLAVNIPIKEWNGLCEQL